MGLLIWLVRTAFDLLFFLIFARVIISWFRPGNVDPRWHKILSFIYNVTEPILGPIRRLLPTGNLGIDFSPIIAFFALSIIRNFLIRFLTGLMFY